MYFEKKGVKKVIILAIFVIIFCLPIFVSSKDFFGLEGTADKAGYDSTQRDIYSVISNVVDIAFGVVAFIFFGLTLYAGIRWITARGQEDLIEKAKSTMEAAIIGLVIISLSYAIASFVIKRLSPSAPTTPGGSVQNSEVNQNCCVCTDNNIGLVSSDPRVMMDTGPGGEKCKQYCTDKYYPNALISGSCD